MPKGRAVDGYGAWREELSGANDADVCAPATVCEWAVGPARAGAEGGSLPSGPREAVAVWYTAAVYRGTGYSGAAGGGPVSICTSGVVRQNKCRFVDSHAEE